MQDRWWHAPPHPTLRTKRTRRVPHPVLIGRGTRTALRRSLLQLLLLELQQLIVREEPLRAECFA